MHKPRPSFIKYFFPNRIKEIDKKTLGIVVTQTNGKVHVFLVDRTEEIRKLISQYTWSIHQGYCCTYQRYKNPQYLPWILFGRPQKGFCWHHLKDRVDNRSENLRLVSRSLNNYFKSVRENKTTCIRGISYYNGIYYALIGLHGKRKGYKTLEEAIVARKKFECEMDQLLYNSPRPNGIKNYSLDSETNRKAA